MLSSLTLSMLVASVKAGDDSITCDITTENNYSYMCSKYDLETSNAGPLGCVQTDMTSDSADTEITTADWQVGCSEGEVIKCFAFASYGKTPGSCGEISSSDSACLFLDDTD